MSKWMQITFWNDDDDDDDQGKKKTNEHRKLEGHNDDV